MTKLGWRNMVGLQRMVEIDFLFANNPVSACPDYGQGHIYSAFLAFHFTSLEHDQLAALNNAKLPTYSGQLDWMVQSSPKQDLIRWSFELQKDVPEKLELVRIRWLMMMRRILPGRSLLHKRHYSKAPYRTCRSADFVSCSCINMTLTQNLAEDGAMHRDRYQKKWKLIEVR